MNYILITLLTCLLAACQQPRQKTEKSEQKPVITVTIEPQRFFTEAIAGDHFDVVSMVPQGSSPESYDPTPQQLATLSKSEAYLRIGYIGFEQVWMDRMTENTPHLQIFDTSKDIDFIFDSCHGHAEGHEHHPEEGIEPHVWTSTGNAFIIARNTFNALKMLDKENEKYYFERYDSLCNIIAQTDSTIRTLLNQPDIHKSFMIYHPALSYFARDYGLKQLPIEEGGKEPSPGQLKTLVDICRQEKVQVIFVQPEFDTRNAEVIAHETGARIVRINPLNYHWTEEMIRIAQELADNRKA